MACSGLPISCLVDLLHVAGLDDLEHALELQLLLWGHATALKLVEGLVLLGVPGNRELGLGVIRRQSGGVLLAVLQVRLADDSET